jgi:tRNA (cytidine/uridine-2'-O-)-methyltransferase
MGFKIDDRKLKRAGLDYWHLLDITYYASLDEFFAKNQRRILFFSTKAVHKHTDMRYPDNCYLFFGKETAGLPEALLFQNKDRCVRIPMLSEARSLNLSNSIAIGVYEVLRQWDFPVAFRSEVACAATTGTRQRRRDNAQFRKNEKFG